MLKFVFLSLITFIITVGLLVPLTSVYFSIMIPIFSAVVGLSILNKTDEPDSSGVLIPIIMGVAILASAGLLFLSSGIGGVFFSLIAVIALLPFLFMSWFIFTDLNHEESKTKIKDRGMLGVDRFSNRLSLVKTILWGSILGMSLSLMMGIISPGNFDSRIFDPVFLKLESYGENEFLNQREKNIFNSIKDGNSRYEIDDYKTLVKINQNKEVYKNTLTSLEKKAEEDRIKNQAAIKASEDRLQRVRSNDGVYSRQGAFSKCSSEIRSKTNSGYYMNYTASRQKSMMESDLSYCMSRYGY
ncbi:MAG: hypothetical protein EVB00_01915 [SAR86 cluster bacterium]|uniref:Uncharacterized protein n=1 Tax=SAR86 cluster bacterium TaxID=2030880 RepID=A0A520M981_9GAMM|nr:MAG: hypothetical protein EVB00_01915 [SAR86 cluster bacterium]